MDGGVPRHARPPLEALAPLQREVVRHPKEPCREVLPRAVEAQVTKEREEHFLDHVFGLVGGQAERCDVAQQGRRAAIEQQQHLFVGSTRRDARALGSEQREVENGIGIQRQHGGL